MLIITYIYCQNVRAIAIVIVIIMVIIMVMIISYCQDHAGVKSLPRTL